MLVHFHAPTPPLNRFIDHCWLVRTEHYPHAREWIFPDGTADLMFNLGPSPHAVVEADSGRITPYRRAWISGGRHRSILVEKAAHGYDLVGVHFRPGGASTFFGMPLIELTDRVIELDELWGGVAEDIRDELAEARTPDRIFPALERAMLWRGRGRLDPPSLVESAIETLTRAEPGASIAALARDIGVSHRRLITAFDEAVGLKPKTLQRILRFQRVISAEQVRPSLDWAAVAIECGYFDQAHLIRDFRMFTGMTPEAYRARRTEYPNAVPEEVGATAT